MVILYWDDNMINKNIFKLGNKKPTFELWEVIVIALIASLIMSVSTGYVVYRSNSNESCSKVVNSKYIGEFVTSYNNIINNYYDKVDQNALIDSAINGMLSYLGDPYTSYLDESNTNLLTDSLTGTYEGIGVQIKTSSDNKLVIDKVFDDSPASKAGIAVNDIITSINGTDVTSKSADEAVKIIKNSNDKKVVLIVNRNGQSLTFNLEVTKLFVPAIEGQVYEKNNRKIGYINISKFSDTVSEQFSNELKKQENDGITGLVIDLRNDTGGYLNEATKIAEMFLKKGKVIYSLQSKLSTDVTKDKTDESRDYKVYIITNNGSASASEILAAALKYSYGSTLVGEKSYGKGKVQKTSNLSDGSMYKYTSAKWLTPNGDCIDGVGLTPDIPVALSQSYSDNPIPENDNQLQTALYEISK
jgi:carboxyl-terminal processing protease